MLNTFIDRFGNHIEGSGACRLAKEFMRKTVDLFAVDKERGMKIPATRIKFSHTVTKYVN